MNAPVAISSLESPTEIRARQHARRDPCVCTTLTRQTEEYGPVEIDMIIWFEITSYSPGYAATWDYPAEGPEYEFAVTDIEFDGCAEPDDAPGPLTEAERATLSAWFEANYDAACDAADRYRPDDDYDDSAYDRWKDEQMERGL